MAGMENKQPVSTTSSVSAARETQSTTPPLGEARTVAFPPPEPEIVPIATTPVSEPELTVKVGDRRTTGHLDLRGNCAVFGRRLLHSCSPSRPAYTGHGW